MTQREKTGVDACESSELRRKVSDPLVVDLDGTLTYSDTLFESALRLVGRQPWRVLQMPFWLMQGRAALKQRISELVDPRSMELPWRTDLVAYLRAERDRGRVIVLATAAHRRIAEAVAAELNCFDRVIATDGLLNNKGAAKLDAIAREVGPHFVYAGDAMADVPIWNAATSAVFANVERATAQQVMVPVERRFENPTQASVRTWLRAMRVHQYVKNLLVFLPLFTSFQFFDPGKVVAGLIAFLAFCLTASATYLANDLWDLDSDRRHPRKQLRPFASGALPVANGVGMTLVLLLAGMLLATSVSPSFAAMLAVYVGLTTAYSLSWKRYVLIDVLCLASLYTWRVLAGAVAVGVSVSPWLLAFSVFIFGSLALVKRCAELVSLRDAGRLVSNGRDYSVGDLVILWPLGVGLGVCAVVVFGLYVGSSTALGLYARSELLWLVGLGLLYWIGRLWIKTARGAMHDDPIVFTLRDRGSRVVIAAMLLVALVAHLGA
jgi:4-hydroxybenzoate polyprenyltransferase/phosphoserine phosphatase